MNYDENNWNLLIAQLQSDHKQIALISRTQLVHDSFNLGRAEYLDQLTFFRLISYFKDKEKDAMPFTPALQGLAYVRAMLSVDYSASKLFDVRKLLAKIFVTKILNMNTFLEICCELVEFNV